MKAGERAAVAPPLTVDYTGRTATFVRLALKVFLLTIVTLTLYRFWGRTEVRRLLWSNITFNGEPLEYTGTGFQLFVGFLTASLFILFPLAAGYFAAQHLLDPYSLRQFAAFAGLYLLFRMLLFMGLYQAWRYRLSRTAFRGLRCELSGSSLAFGLLGIGWTILNTVSLGLLTPVVDVRLMRRLANNISFGDQRFSFKAKARHLYGSFLLSVIIGLVLFGAIAVAIGATFPRDLLPTAGTAPPPDTIERYIPYVVAIFFGGIVATILATLFYQERRLRVFGSAFGIGDAKFLLDAHFISYVRLVLGNVLLIFLSLGFAVPIAEHRIFRYIFRRLRVEGTIAFDAIGASKGPRPRFGEGLAEAFGFGNV